MSIRLKQFQFFTFHEVLEKSTRSSFSLLKDIHITSITYGKDNIIISDSSGSIYILNKLLSNITLKFGAYSSCVSLMYACMKIPYLFCVGSDHNEPREILKIFDLKTLDNQGVPLCSKQLKICCSDENYIVTVMSIYDRLSQMAFGFSSGAILYLKGDLIDRKGIKEKEIRSFNTPITGIEFMRQDDSVFMFVTTLESVAVINIQQSYTISMLDLIGCNLKCLTIIENDNNFEFCIACDDGIYCYTSVGRTKCIPISGKKKLLKSFKNNLAIITKNEIVSQNITVERNIIQSIDTLQIITIDNNIKYYSFIKEIGDIFDIVYIWGSLYIFMCDCHLFELIPIDLEQKIKILFNKNLFDIAINLAEKHGNEEMLNRIICKYGDNLYSKGELDLAIDEYIKTIGTIEPSYVIKKFLDAQNIKYLTKYLEILHIKNVATSDHTTLLLNCHIRMKDICKLDDFLKKDAECHFDVETALRVCYQAGLIEQALFLAKKFQKHSWFLKITLEDVKDYRSALQYLKNLNVIQAQQVLKTYGRRLLKDAPNQLLEYLKLICTPTDSDIPYCNAEDFIHIFIQQRSYLKLFLEHIINTNKDCSIQIYNIWIEIHLYEISIEQNLTIKNDLESKCLHIINSKEGKYDTDHVLMLCQLNNFIKGLVILYEKTHKYMMILQYHIDSKDYESIINDCIKYGVNDTQLWMRSLEFFAQNYHECEQYLIRLISAITNNNVLTSINLIQILSQYENIKVGLVKDHICEQFDKISYTLKQNDKEIIKNKQQINDIQNNIDSIESESKIFQNLKCSLCLNSLDLPVIHYLCGHSFHQLCAQNTPNEDECNICIEEINNAKYNFIPNFNSNNDLLTVFENEIISSNDPIIIMRKFLKFDIFNNSNTFDA